MKRIPLPHRAVAALTAASLLGGSFPVAASSHREAPNITTQPKLDCTDFYVFNSYEPGRSNYVTFVANYLPLQDSYGGPNYFKLETNGVYEIHIDNNGDAREDITFQFQFSHVNTDFQLPIGTGPNQKSVSIPLIAAGGITAGNNGALFTKENYQVKVIRDARRTGPSDPITISPGTNAVFTKPVDNIGNKTLPDYVAYANQYIYDINLPGFASKGRLFVGQRQDPFVVNLGEVFDLVNLNPLQAVDGSKNIIDDKNVTSIILELPKEYLVVDNDSVIGAWTTSSRRDGANLVQVSRLSHPLVNEVVIGLKDKDAFNASEPVNDPQFLDYVTHPTLPALLNILFGVTAPTAIPRGDLVAVFLTGVPTLNKSANFSAPGEYMRLNTSIPAKPRATQSNLGVLAGDAAGFPNGRRPGDDVVDIALRAVMGVLLSTNDAPHGQLPYTDGALVNASMFPDRFPYLNPPLAGSPNDPSICITLQTAGNVTGPYKSQAITFDPVTQKITTSKPMPADSKQFYQLKTDTSRVTLGKPEIGPTDVKIPVSQQ